MVGNLRNDTKKKGRKYAALLDLGPFEGLQKPYRYLSSASGV